MESNKILDNLEKIALEKQIQEQLKQGNRINAQFLIASYEIRFGSFLALNDK